MNKREKLLELAGRCEAGEMFVYSECKQHSATVLPDGFDNRGRVSILYDAQESLDAVAALERELLPERCEISISKNNSRFEDLYWKTEIHQWPEDYAMMRFLSQATASTEPLARLAALLKALAEMEGSEDDK